MNDSYSSCPYAYKISNSFFLRFKVKETYVDKDDVLTKAQGQERTVSPSK